MTVGAGHRDLLVILYLEKEESMRKIEIQQRVRFMRSSACVRDVLLLPVVVVVLIALIMAGCATTDPLQELRGQIDQLQADQQTLAQQVAQTARVEELRTLTEALTSLRDQVAQESAQVQADIETLTASSAPMEWVASLETEISKLSEGYDLIESMIMRLLEHGGLASSDDLVEFGFSLMDIAEKIQSVDAKLERFKAAMAAFIGD